MTTDTPQPVRWWNRPRFWQCVAIFLFACIGWTKVTAVGMQSRVTGADRARSEAMASRESARVAADEARKEVQALQVKLKDAETAHETELADLRQRLKEEQTKRLSAEVKLAGADRTPPPAPAAPVAAAVGTAPVVASQAIITSKALADEYAKNEVGADLKYKGQPVRVSGRLDGVALGIFDEVIVHLEGTGLFNSVDLRFKEGQAAKVGALEKGAKYTFECVGSGELLASPQLKDCAVL